jgi:hypothetical protein
LKSTVRSSRKTIGVTQPPGYESKKRKKTRKQGAQRAAWDRSRTRKGARGCSRRNGGWARAPRRRRARCPSPGASWWGRAKARKARRTFCFFAHQLSFDNTPVDHSQYGPRNQSHSRTHPGVAHPSSGVWSNTPIGGSRYGSPRKSKRPIADSRYGPCNQIEPYAVVLLLLYVVIEDHDSLFVMVRGRRGGGG